jgi:hypothetical protein
MEIVMSPSGAAVDNDQGWPLPLFFDIELAAADVDPALDEVQPVAPAGNSGDFSDKLLFDMNDPVQRRLALFLRSAQESQRPECGEENEYLAQKGL